MKKLHLLLAAGAFFGGGVLSGLALAAGGEPAEAGVTVVFDNSRATVREVVMTPGARRPARTRPTDELVLFPEEAHYQAIDSRGEKQPRDRRPGTVVFHTKGELAPTLVNTSTKPVRYFSIALK